MYAEKLEEAKRKQAAKRKGPAKLLQEAGLMTTRTAADPRRRDRPSPRVPPRPGRGSCVAPRAGLSAPSRRSSTPCRMTPVVPVDPPCRGIRVGAGASMEASSSRSSSSSHRPRGPSPARTCRDPGARCGAWRASDGRGLCDASLRSVGRCEPPVPGNSRPGVPERSPVGRRGRPRSPRPSPPTRNAASTPRIDSTIPRRGGRLRGVRRLEEVMARLEAGIDFTDEEDVVGA